MASNKRSVTRIVRRSRRQGRRQPGAADIALERETVKPLSSQDREALSTRSTQPLDADTLLRAQRTLGNRAVSRLIDERSNNGAETPSLDKVGLIQTSPLNKNGQVTKAKVKGRTGTMVQRGMLGDLWEGTKEALGTAAAWLGDVLNGPGKSGKGAKGKGSGTTPEKPAKKSKAEKKREKKVAGAIKQATLSKTELDELKKKGEEALNTEWAKLAAEEKELEAEKKPLWKRRRSTKEPLSEVEQERLDELKALIKAKGKRIAAIKLILAKSQIEKELDGASSSVSKWFGGIATDATFLDVRIRPSKGSVSGGVHNELLTQLKLAEDFLMKPEQQKKHGYKTKKEAAAVLGIHGIGGLRPPQAATGGSRISMHCYGLAIDINVSANPFVGRSADAIDVIKRATELVDGTPFNIAKRPKDITVMDMYDLLSKANDALQLYLTLESNDELLAKKVEALNKKLEPTEGEKGKKKGETKSVEAWKKQIKQDLKALKNTGDFGSRDPAAGFMDLPRILVDALVNAGGLTWGGFYRTAKDIMHFDYRKSSTIKR